MADENEEQPEEERGPVDIAVVQEGEHVTVVLSIRLTLAPAALFAKALSGAVTTLFMNEKKKQRIVVPGGGDPRIPH